MYKQIFRLSQNEKKYTMECLYTNQYSTLCNMGPWWEGIWKIDQGIGKKNADVKFKVANVIISICVEDHFAVVF